jgi:hypothetical protein
LKQEGFGEFQLDAARIAAGLAQDGANALDKIFRPRMGTLGATAYNWSNVSIP